MAGACKSIMRSPPGLDGHTRLARGRPHEHGASTPTPADTHPKESEELWETDSDGDAQELMIGAQDFMGGYSLIY